MSGPRRIVCLTEEPTETLYALGEQDRIVGISGFTVRPPQARRDKHKVSAFTSAKIDAILALQPDLAIGFSDIQADIAAELVRRGVEVWIANHRSVDGILDYVRRLGALVGAAQRASEYADALQRRLDAVAQRAALLPVRPKVYFEEWDAPIITGIRWVGELVAIAGGEDVFPELSAQPLAKGRILADGDVVALDSIDLSIDKGDIYGIIGMSGAGKSTLIRCLNRLDSPTEGQVLIDGHNVFAMSPQELRATRRRMAMIFQHFNLLMQKTVARNVRYPLEIAGVPKKQANARVEELLLARVREPDATPAGAPAPDSQSPERSLS